MKRTRKNKKNLIGLNSKHRQIVREHVKWRKSTIKQQLKLWMFLMKRHHLEIPMASLLLITWDD